MLAWVPDVRERPVSVRRDIPPYSHDQIMAVGSARRKEIEEESMNIRLQNLFERWGVCSLLCMSMGFAWLARADEPRPNPVLRVEVGMHNARVADMSVDREGGLLATVSSDKTLRIWDQKSGKPIRVIRPPINSNGEGELYAVAISPSGDLVAVGGNTPEPEGGYTTYLFRTANGQMAGRITHLPGQIVRLAWSHNGGLLLALTHDGTLRVFQRNEREIRFVAAANACDSPPRNTVVDADIDNEGRIVASCDRVIRLGKVEGESIRFTRRNAHATEHYFRKVRFSPDGAMIATVSTGAEPVGVFDGQRLDFLYAPSMRGLIDEHAYTVAWSLDGESLFVGSTDFYFGNRLIIRQWKDRGNGDHNDVAISDGAGLLSIKNITPLRGGRIAFSLSEPSWGVVGPSGLEFMAKGHGNINYFMRRKFLVSPDGNEIGIEYSTTMDQGIDWGRFSVAERRISLTLNQRGLEMQLENNKPLLDISGWRSTPKKGGQSVPKINGTPISLNPGEYAESLAVSHDGDVAAVGTSRGIYLFDRGGSRLWERATPAHIESLNLPAGNRVVVAGFHDDTVRWYRLRDGELLLSLRPLPNRKSWILWTPSGYYDASPGAEDLIGWHVNRGKDQAADFFPASRFRDKFYRPDVVQKILTTLDEKEALRLADAEAGRKATTTPRIADILPPVVTILSPAHGSEFTDNRVTLRFHVNTPADAPVREEDISFQINGQLVSTQRAGIRILASKENVREVTLPLKEAENEIRVSARNRHGESVPGSLRVTWSRAGTKQQSASRLVLLAAGVSEYEHDTVKDLDLAAKDAVDFTNAMKLQQGGLYREVKVRLLCSERPGQKDKRAACDGPATREAIFAGLRWLQDEVTEHDDVMIFLAGHGERDAEMNYYFMPQNGVLANLAQTAVGRDAIIRTLRNLEGRRKTAFLDTCKSGSLLTGNKRGSADMTRLINELTDPGVNVTVFAAAEGFNPSEEDTKWGNGAFTKAVVEGLRALPGEPLSRDPETAIWMDAARKSKRITSTKLAGYVDARVKELTDKQQQPVTHAPGGLKDFEIARLK